MTAKRGSNVIDRLLDDERIRSVPVADQTLYSAADLVAVLTESPDAFAEWDEIKAVEPALRSRCVRTDLGGEPQDALSLSGIMRLIQVIDSPKAERLRGWLAEVAARHVEEQADPELAIQRMRQSYAAQGRTRHWIDQRLRSISARQEVVSEWYHRGIKNSEQFRELTNKLMEMTFGMDVNAFCQSKGFSRNLRDHLDELELSLLSLAETTAASLHRDRKSSGSDQLLRDIADAGQIVSQTRDQIARARMNSGNEIAA